MGWTDRTPTAAGWYWVAWAMFPHHQLARVVVSEAGRAAVKFADTGPAVVPPGDGGALWYGPLVMPAR
jgi:hypothetical protein